MKNKFVQKMIIIGISLLMLFSLVGQFLVSAEELEDGAINEPIETEEVIIDPIEDEIEENIEEELEDIIEETEKVVEPQVEPYEVVDTPAATTNQMQTYAVSDELHNPPLEKDDYELVTINPEGRMEHKGWYTDFDEAYAVMKSIRSAALRHHKSHSPMKFIAATRGILQAVPHRTNGNATMHIYDYKKPFYP